MSCLEQLVHFSTQEKNTLDLILTSLPGQFQEIHSLDILSDHDMISGTLKIHILPKRNLGSGWCFCTKREGKMHQILQRIITSMVTQIIAPFRKTLT